MDREVMPFDGTPHAISIGVRRLNLNDWLDLGARVDRVRAKGALLGTVHHQVVMSVPGSEPGGAEVLELVVDHLRERGLVERDDDRIVDLETGTTWSTDGTHPLDLAARLVAEDLCLLEERPDIGSGYTLTAGSVCFPSRWSLADKIGTSLRTIHDPVPGYDGIADATDRYFDAIAADRPVYRVNWTLIDDPALFQPEPARRDPSFAARDLFDDPATQVFLRIERQTLRRLPQTGGVLFTIDTDVRALSTLSQAQRADLAGSLEGVGPFTVSYKGWAALLPAVEKWARRGDTIDHESAGA